MKNVLLRDGCSYQRMLAKCVAELYSEEEQQQYDFYIADAQGIAVWNGDSTAIDLESSGETTEECEWTLMQYIMLIISKARFFCVKKDKGLH